MHQRALIKRNSKKEINERSEQDLFFVLQGLGSAIVS